LKDRRKKIGQVSSFIPRILEFLFLALQRLKKSRKE